MDLRVEEHTLHLEIFTSGKKLQSEAAPVAQNAHRLARLPGCIQIRRLQRLFDMERAPVSAFVNPVIVIEPVGHVAALLDLGHQDTGTDGMHGSGLDKEDVVLFDRHMIELFSCSSA